MPIIRLSSAAREELADLVRTDPTLVDVKYLTVGDFVWISSHHLAKASLPVVTEMVRVATQAKMLLPGIVENHRQLCAVGDRLRTSIFTESATLSADSLEFDAEELRGDRAMVDFSRVADRMPALEEIANATSARH